MLGLGFTEMRAALQGVLESGLFEEDRKHPGAVACRKNRPNCPLAGPGVYPIYPLIGLERGRYLAIGAPNSFSLFICFGVIRTGSDVAGRNRFFEKQRKTAKGGSLSVDGDGEGNVLRNDQKSRR
jgi:hypothetical protein